MNLSDGMIETLKDQCKIHRITTLIKHTGLSEIVIKRWLKEHDSKFPKVSILGVESLFQGCRKRRDYTHQLLHPPSDFQTF